MKRTDAEASQPMEPQTINEETKRAGILGSARVFDVLRGGRVEANIEHASGNRNTSGMVATYVSRS